MNDPEHQQDLAARRIGGILGPSMMAIVAAEFPLVQPHLYDAQIPPVVYLSGALLFVAGLAIVRAHHHWALKWTVLITLTGWVAVLLGLVRMFAASAYASGAAQTPSAVWMVLEGLLFAAGLAITLGAYRRKRP